MFIHRKKIQAWGLDIGDRSIKLASISPQSDGFTIVNSNSIDIPEGFFDNGKIINTNGIVEKITELITTTKGPKLHNTFVHSALPETQTYIKLIKIPFMTDSEIPEAVQWASEHHIPIPPDQIYLDWQVVNREEKHINVLIGAAPKEVSDSYTELLKQSNLVPLSLEIEATPIARALLDHAEIKKDKQHIAIIDMGASRTSLIMYAGSSIQFTNSLPFSGEEITATLAKDLSLSYEQAEKAKIVCGLNPKKCNGALLQVLETNMKELARKVTAAFDFYKSEFELAEPITKIILCGGGAHFQGMQTILSEELQLPVTSGNPLLHCKVSNKNIIPENKLLSYTTAIGLALKAYE